MKNNIFYTIIILFFTTSVLAQNVSFNCSAPSDAQTGVPFSIKYTLKAPKKGTDFNYSKVSGLNVLHTGTSQYSSYSTTIINGKMKSKQTITLTWNLTVKAIKTGRISIPPATVTVDGKEYKSNSVTVNVSKNKTNVAHKKKNKKISNLKDVFLNVSTNKSNAYIGEPVYAYCKLYSIYDVSLNDFKPSTFDNFWIKELEMPSSIKAITEKINGKNYLTAILDKRLIFPQKTGKLKIKPYDVTLQLYDNWGFPAGSKRVVSNTKVLNVKPLPNPKPDNFNGAVGVYDISLSADLKKVNVDQAITFTLKISGSGNFGLFDMPKINLHSTFEQLEPEYSEDYNIASSGINGSKSAKYVFIPRVPGNYTVKPVKFSFFDLNKKQYVSLKTDTINFTVTGDSSDIVSANSGGLVKSNATKLGEDIRFIKLKTNLKQKNNFLFGKNVFWLFYLVPFLFFLFLIFFLRKKIKENANLKLVNYKKADKVSRKRLKKAEKFMTQKSFDKFYEEISLALWGYVSDKLSIPRSDLTRQTAVETLNNKNIQKKSINDFINIIDDCETARFAPSAFEYKPEDIYKRATNIIKNFEKNIS